MKNKSWAVEILELDDTGLVDIGIYSVNEKSPLGGKKYVVLPNEHLSEADARVMAAAPELLDALKTILQEAGPLAYDFEPFIMAKKAIAKAEGK